MIELNECFYCHTNLMPSGLMIPIGTLNVSDLYLLCDQKNTGRCIVAYNKCHVRELFELSADDRIAFIEDICRVSAVLKELFSAKKINYGRHVHQSQDPTQQQTRRQHDKQLSLIHILNFYAKIVRIFVRIICCGYLGQYSA